MTPLKMLKSSLLWQSYQFFGWFFGGGSVFWNFLIWLSWVFQFLNIYMYFFRTPLFIKGGVQKFEQAFEWVAYTKCLKVKMFHDFLKVNYFGYHTLCYSFYLTKYVKKHIKIALLELKQSKFSCFGLNSCPSRQIFSELLRKL